VSALTSLEPHHGEAPAGRSSFSSQARQQQTGRRFESDPTETS